MPPPLALCVTFPPRSFPGCFVYAVGLEKRLSRPSPTAWAQPFTRRFSRLLLMILLLASCIPAADTVVLVHGLGLGPWAMHRVEKTSPPTGNDAAFFPFESSSSRSLAGLR